MVSGKRAFAGQSLIQTLNRIAHEEPEPLGSLDGGLPAELQRIVRKCLAKSPARRYQTAGDLTVDLLTLGADVDAGRGMVASEPGADAQAAPAAWTPARRALVGACMIVSLLAGLALSTLLRPQDPAPGVRRGAMFVNERLLRSSNWPAIAVSPDGRRLAYLAGEGFSDLALYVRGLDQLEGIRLVDYAASVSFSPDGNWILFRDGSYRLRKVPVGGGAPQTLAEDIGSLRGQSWGPDGRVVYAPRSGDSGLFSVSATGGEPRQLTTPEDRESHRWPHYLPGGEGLIFTRVSASNSPSLVYLDLETLESTPLRDDAGSGRVLPTGQILWITDGALYASAFDRSGPALVGAAVPVAESVLSSTSGGAVYSIAANGTLVYLQGSADGTSSTIAWEGSPEPLIEGGIFGAPALSPEGSRLAYTVHDGAGGSAIWVRDLPDGVPARLTFEAGRVLRPIWAASGDQIYYMQRKEGDDANSEQLLVAADGSSAPEPPANPQTTRVDAVAPGGEFVVLGQESDLFVLPLTDDAEPLPLAVSPALEAWPAVSPNGQWIAYASNETGTWSVFVRAWPDRGGVRQIPHAGSAGHPRWSADGRTLYARVNAGVLAVPVNVRGDSLSFGTPSMEAVTTGGVFAGRQLDGWWLPDYDIGPDGRVVVVRDQIATALDIQGHAVVVYNWFDEVSRRVAEGQ
jgi:Tol biopolymer transport system component